jgi:hypothetical protein
MRDNADFREAAHCRQVLLNHGSSGPYFFVSIERLGTERSS